MVAKETQSQQHQEVFFVTPEWYGSFQDYTGMFIDDDVYNEKKHSETQSDDNEEERTSRWFARYSALIKGLKQLDTSKPIKFSNRQLADIMGISEGSVRNDLYAIQKLEKDDNA